MDCSEIEVELDADAVAVAAGMVAIGKSPDVVNAQDGEDVVKAYPSLEVWLAAHGLAKSIGREQEDIVAR